MKTMAKNDDYKLMTKVTGAQHISTPPLLALITNILQTSQSLLEKKALCFLCVSFLRVVMILPLMLSA